MKIFPLSDVVYETLKWIAMVLLPALIALYAAIAAIWGLPLAEEIVSTGAALNAFLGILLGISTAEYRKVN